MHSLNAPLCVLVHINLIKRRQSWALSLRNNNFSNRTMWDISRPCAGGLDRCWGTQHQDLRGAGLLAFGGLRMHGANLFASCLLGFAEILFGSFHGLLVRFHSLIVAS
jgi:hypothetical protein